MNAMQQKNFEHMVSLGMPDVWAWLIAERSANDLSDEKSMTDCINGAFAWLYSEEGSEFWRDASFAIEAEEDHANSLRADR